MTQERDKPEKPMQRERTDESATAGGLSREATIKIGQQLRAMYDEVVKEGVPDRFNDLLKRLDGGKGSGEGHS
jgi:Anti-sigma factor NepR